MERYLASVTEVGHLKRGNTVLYVPHFDPAAAGAPGSTDAGKDTVPRLETLVVHWTR